MSQRLQVLASKVEPNELARSLLGPLSDFGDQLKQPQTRPYSPKKDKIEKIKNDDSDVQGADAR